MKEAHYHYATYPMGYPMRIELMIAESQPAVLPLNYGHHIEALSSASIEGDRATETFAPADTRSLLPL